MSRRNKAAFFADGVLVVDKPAGPTSHDVVQKLRRRYKPSKLGHAGTLDPFATGVLVLLFNRATRMANLLGGGDKLYGGVISLGAATDTGDPTGQVIADRPAPELDERQAAEALRALEGPREQVPPAYSAAKHQGKPLYAYAREGVQVQKPPRPITVHSARLTGLAPGEISFEMLCSRGTYVRSLAEDLAQDLGTVGHLKQLCRLASAPFALSEALGLDEALDLGPAELAERMVPLGAALARCGLPAVEVDEDLAWRIRQGEIIPRAELLGGDDSTARSPFRVERRGELVAVLRWLEPGEKRPGRDYESIRVFPEPQQSRLSSKSSASAMVAE